MLRKFVLCKHNINMVYFVCLSLRQGLAKYIVCTYVRSCKRYRYQSNAVQSINVKWYAGVIHHIYVIVRIKSLALRSYYKHLRTIPYLCGWKAFVYFLFCDTQSTWLHYGGNGERRSSFSFDVIAVQ